MLKAVLASMPTYTMSCFKLPVSLYKRIQSALTRFWWDSSAGQKKMCWIAWSKMTKSKQDGGLGFKDISNFNDALLAKVSWRILKNPSCLLAKTLLGKYCRTSSFLDCPTRNSASHGWKGICLGRDLIKSQLGRSIGSGADTLIWNAPWISLSASVTPMGPPTHETQFMTVKDLICPISKTWNREKITTYLPHYQSEIFQLRPSRFGARGKFIWIPTKSGEYSTRTGYYAAEALQRLHRDAPPQPVTFNWNSEIWKKKCSPKIKFLLWKALKNALPLGANLKARGINPTAACPYCSAEESGLHLFFLCPFAAQIWEQAPFKNTLSTFTFTNLQRGFEAAKHLICLPPVGLGPFPLFPWLIWSIWTCRNKKVFEQKHLSSRDVISQAIVAAKEWFLAQPLPQGIQTLPPSPFEPVVESDAILCFTDAAWREDSLEAGLGWIFVDNSNHSEIQDHAVAREVSSPLMAEAIALFSAIQQASNRGFKKLVVASDSQQLVEAILRELHPKELQGILHDILFISLNFVAISFQFVKRENNCKADAVAKAALLAINSVPV